MRRLLLAALCMAATLVFAPMALAEDTPTATAAAAAQYQYASPAAAAQYQYASPTATASPTASPLPETGGAVSPAAIAVVAALLLVGSGIISASIIRRT